MEAGLSCVSSTSLKCFKLAKVFIPALNTTAYKWVKWLWTNQIFRYYLEKNLWFHYPMTQEEQTGSSNTSVKQKYKSPLSWSQSILALLQFVAGETSACLGFSPWTFRGIFSPFYYKAFENNDWGLLIAQNVRKQHPMPLFKQPGCSRSPSHYTSGLSILPFNSAYLQQLPSFHSFAQPSLSLR